MEIKINPIGFVRAKNGTFSIELEQKYIPALKNLDGFSHLQILWWGHLFADTEHREILTADKPYKKGPDKIGIFATRSQMRPNPVLITNIYVHKIDYENGILYTPFIDAEDGTPIIDIKPYHKSERVKQCSVPDWCGHWPEWDEDSAEFDWQNEFNF